MRSGWAPTGSHRTGTLQVGRVDDRRSQPVAEAGASAGGSVYARPDQQLVQRVVHGHGLELHADGARFAQDWRGGGDELACGALAIARLPLNPAAMIAALAVTSGDSRARSA